MRARIVPGCDEGLSNTAVANKSHITEPQSASGASVS